MVNGIRRSRVVAAGVGLVLAGCGGDAAGISSSVVRDDLLCDLDSRFIADGGVGRDGIPALDAPVFLPLEPRVEEISYFRVTDRVIGYRSPNGDWLAIPHNVMWRHEIVNLPEVSITYCPLTGSALAFATLSVGGTSLGVSGLLYNANLILYDRQGTEEAISLWPQMLGEARCGPRSGQALSRVPVYEMTWEAWVELHPDTKVLALTEDMFDPALYFFNPYGDSYENPHNRDYLGFPMEDPDERRPLKERVLGLPDGAGSGTVFPFLLMAEAGARGAFPFDHGGEAVVVLWDRDSQASHAFRAEVDGRPAVFTAVADGFQDDETGTVWAVDGTPVSGPLSGTSQRLTAMPDPYVAFWGAWAALFPGTEIAGVDFALSGSVWPE